MDQLFHPTQYAAFQEAEQEQQLPAPAPSPGDQLRPARSQEPTAP